MLAFVIWCICGCLFIGIGIYDFFSKTAVGFWANAKKFSVTDVKKYNHAVGILWIVYGGIFIALGLPLLKDQESVMILFSVLGVMAESIGMMIVYVLGIEKRYKKSLNDER